LKKEIEVVSAQPGMRRLPRASGWKTGQEEGVELRDEIGQIWYLLSGEVGCESSSSHVTGTVPARPEEGGTKPDVKYAKETEGGEEEKDDGEEEEKGCWLREIVIETLSKDQGWSSAVTAHPTLYGMIPPCFPLPTTLICRYIRPKLFMVRDLHSEERHRGRRHSPLDIEQCPCGTVLQGPPCGSGK